MRRFVTELESISPHSQGRFHATPKLDKELADAYEDRTWRERLHVDETGQVIITPMMLKNCLSDTAKFLSMQIPGKGKQTYTKHFEAGILVLEPIPLGIKKDEVLKVTIPVPSDGRRGGTKRVTKHFPTITHWKGKAEIHVLDDTITKDVLMEHLVAAGTFIGMGTFRPRNNGINGRFRVLSLKEVK